MKIIKVDSIKIADSFFKRLRGYMFHKEPYINEVLIIKPCNQVHTFNMKFDIDVLFMNNDHVVIQRHLGVKPGKILPRVEKATCVAEAKAGLFVDVEENQLIRFEV